MTEIFLHSAYVFLTLLFLVQAGGCAALAEALKHHDDISYMHIKSKRFLNYLLRSTPAIGALLVGLAFYMDKGSVAYFMLLMPCASLYTSYILHKMLRNKTKKEDLSSLQGFPAARRHGIILDSQTIDQLVWTNPDPRMKKDQNEPKL